MPTAEIITIGTEILLGEIQDTNTSYLARCLSGIGVDLFRTTSIGDNPGRIAQVINEAQARCDIVIMTGGLGPTVDDPTRQAVAQATDRVLEFHPDLWQKIQERFHRSGRTASENNRRQAYIPTGAVVIENPVGTAPSFLIETDRCVLISLPGVPREMEYLVQNAVIPYLLDHFHLTGTIKVRVLHTASVGESQIDEKVGDLEELGNPTVGLLAYPGRTDIRIAVKADHDEEANKMLDLIAAEIYKRLGDAIYGEDKQSLESVLVDTLAASHLHLRVYVNGFVKDLQNRLIGFESPFIKIQDVQIEAPAELKKMIQAGAPVKSEIQIGSCLKQDGKTFFLSLFTVINGEITEDIRSFTGETSLAPIWAGTITLDHIRLFINKHFNNRESERK